MGLNTTAYYKIKAAIEESQSICQKMYEREVVNDPKYTKPQAIVIEQGGQGASKNYSNADIMLNYCAENDNWRSMILASSYAKLQDGALEDFKAILDFDAINIEDHYNNQSKNITFGTGKIKLRHVKDYKHESGKSIRNDLIYINESTEISYQAVEQYINRAKIVIIDHNPDYEHWPHTILEKREQCVKVILTHWDNELLPEQERSNIESKKYKKDENQNYILDAKGEKIITEWYKVYGQGKIGTIAEGRIFEYRIIDKVPEGVKRLPSGVDFGRSPDKTSLIDEYLDKNNLILDEVFTEGDLRAETIPGDDRMSVAGKFDEVGHKKDWLTFGDSAGGLEINDLISQGYNIIPVTKGTDSVKIGRTLMKNYNILITARSVNLIKAFESYFHKRNPNPKGTDDKYIPEPKGHEPDPIAAARYGLMGAKVYGEL